MGPDARPSDRSSWPCHLGPPRVSDLSTRFSGPGWYGGNLKARPRGADGWERPHPGELYKCSWEEVFKGREGNS